MVLEDEKMREFLEKKEKGTLTIQRIRQNLGTVQMGDGERGQGDGLLHYGQTVRIKNCELLSFVACDPGDAENPEEQLFACSGSRQDEPTARNVWVLEKYDDGHEFLPLPTSGEDDDLVHYGDRFTLRTTEAIGTPFYLASVPVDWSHFSRVSRKQLVFSTQEKSYKCLWKIDSVGQDTSFDMEGEPVPLRRPVFIKHNSTGSPLACRESQVLNDYGSEFELVASREPGKKMMWRFITR
jgi:hypothetical protein